ncbi:hypothetical protein POF50_008150 [Streptomyces sp. SL13]|uniref:Uncharacterized protein n=1 Tax=Streptantibioticus silvisoli TaxID=2705255 RepID=A0AA90H0V7_9ACTN|nr:hypothetical protein [Streptantibioticus silvisoli]MDI5963447.1 hypothetical protein [Streptantibioticus silvisoli]MDI5969316.1 hypothetical protein [Streptantibioticus silvisoli]
MTMSDWKITGAMENLTGDWVYYVCTGVAAFAQLHMSRHVDSPGDDHMATNDRRYYYYGVTGTFNAAARAAPQAVRQLLVDAWRNYYSVQ